MAPRFQTLLSASLALLALSVSAPAQTPAPKLVITHAHIMTMAGPIDAKRPPIDGYISIAPDGKILSVAAGDPPAGLHAATTIDAHGDYIVPGFISAHSHLWQAATAASPPTKPSTAGSTTSTPPTPPNPPPKINTGSPSSAASTTSSAA